MNDPTVGLPASWLRLFLCATQELWLRAYSWNVGSGDPILLIAYSIASKLSTTELKTLSGDRQIGWEGVVPANQGPDSSYLPLVRAAVERDIATYLLALYDLAGRASLLAQLSTSPPLTVAIAPLGSRLGV